MAMKVVWTVLYLAAMAVTMFLGNKIVGSSMKGIQTGRVRTWAGLAAGTAMLVLSFVQFFCLTGMFPVQLILLLVLANLLGIGIYLGIGAVAGFTLPEKRQKISVLQLIMGQQRPVTSCIGTALSSLVFLTSTVCVLWVFWHHRRGDPDAKVLIAFFQFILPQLALVPVSILLLWPAMTSEYLDDDLRNAQLARGFSGIIGNTLVLVFPLWLLRPEVGTYFAHRGWALPPFWLPLSLPIILFILGSLVPFFIGVYRHRSQARVMSQWEEKWMREVLPVLKLPLGSTRGREIDDRLAKLGQEVEERISSNEEIFRYYQTITVGSAGETEPAPPAAPVVETTAQALPAELEPAREPPGGPVLLLPQRIASLQRLVPRPLRPPPRDDANLAETIQNIVRMHIAKLEEWDIRFAYLRRLIQLGQVVSDGRANEVSGFVEVRLKSSEGPGTESGRPNMIAAWVISLLSSAIPLLVKKYETEILDLIGRLVK